MVLHRGLQRELAPRVLAGGAAQPGREREQAVGGLFRLGARDAPDREQRELLVPAPDQRRLLVREVRGRIGVGAIERFVVELLALRQQQVQALGLAHVARGEQASHPLPGLVRRDPAIRGERCEDGIAGLRRLAARLEERARLALGLRIRARKALLQREARDLRVVRDEARMLRPEQVPRALRGEALEPFAPQRLGQRPVGIAAEEGADLGGVGAVDLAHQQPVLRVRLERMAREARAEVGQRLPVALLPGLLHREHVGVGGRGAGFDRERGHERHRGERSAHAPHPLDASQGH